MILRRTTAGLLIALASTGALVACKGKTTPGGTTIVTVTASGPSPVPSGSGSAGGSSATPSGSTTAAATAGPVPTGMTKLPGRCETRLAPAAIADAIGRSIAGRTAFVVGLPDRSTGRITYLNCRYGAKNADNPVLEIAVSLYRTAGQAAARVPLTITDFEDNSADSSATTVDGAPATILIGGQAPGYGPSLVMSYGQRTIAVTFRSGSVAAADAKQQLISLAQLAIARTNPAT